ncbi:MAG TPA: flagellar export chaperone FliS [Verrucomicrobiae bacterium]|nr:flagellar export chaperone FliS [Verrucomicrobiae bacterium]
MMNKTWREAYLQNRVMSAEPIELICMLYQRAIELVGEARQCLTAGNILGRSKAISTTLEILAELEGSLNHQAGGKISENLERLYRHMRTRLMTANLKQQEQPLAEVEALLNTLAEGWEGVRSKTASSAAGTAAEIPMGLNPWGVVEEPGRSGEGWKA